MFKHLVGKSICYGHADFACFDLLGAKEIHLPLKKMPEKYKDSFGEFLDAKIYQGFVQRQNGNWQRVYVLLKINPQDIIEDVFVDEQGLCEHLLVAQKEEAIKKCGHLSKRFGFQSVCARNGARETNDRNKPYPKSRCKRLAR